MFTDGCAVMSMPFDKTLLLEEFWNRDKIWVSCFGKVPMGCGREWQFFECEKCPQPHSIEMWKYANPRVAEFNLRLTVKLGMQALSNHLDNKWDLLYGRVTKPTK